jgi:hypothetical protein
MNVGQNLQIKDILIMKQLCTTCHTDFTSHSFNALCNTLEGGQLFYTKISNASMYDDTDGIVKHCTNYLNHLNPDKWSWVIDFEDFGFKHTLGLNTGIQLSKLINRFGRLKYLLVINTNTFVEQMLKITKFTLNKEYHDCIQIIHLGDEFTRTMEKWTYLDENKTILGQIIKSHEPSSSNRQ